MRLAASIVAGALVGALIWLVVFAPAPTGNYYVKASYFGHGHGYTSQVMEDVRLGRDRTIYYGLTPQAWRVYDYLTSDRPEAPAPRYQEGSV